MTSARRTEAQPTETTGLAEKAPGHRLKTGILVTCVFYVLAGTVSVAIERLTITIHSPQCLYIRHLNSNVYFLSEFLLARILFVRLNEHQDNFAQAVWQ